MRLLKLGAEGTDVAHWQAFLLRQGFAIVVDGDFGQKTHDATVDFQRRNGLEPDGKAGPNTVARAKELGFAEPEGDPVTPVAPEDFPPRPLFPMLKIEQVKTLFGEFRYIPAPQTAEPDAIRILDGWEAQNIVRVTIPQLRNIPIAKPAGNVRFNRKAVDQLVALWQAWDDAGLLPHVLTYAGAFNARFMRGSHRTRLSNHAWGTAFDINADWNGLGRRPALRGAKGSVRELVPIAHEHGFFWGGHFPRPDGMHFEIAVLK